MNNFDILKEVLPNGKTQFALKDFVTILLESYFFQKCKVTFVKNSVRLFKEIDVNITGTIKFQQLMEYIVDYQKKMCINHFKPQKRFKKLIQIYDPNSGDIEKLYKSQHVLKHINFNNYIIENSEHKDRMYILMTSRQQKRFFLLNKQFQVLQEFKANKLYVQEQFHLNIENRICSYDIDAHSNRIVFLFRNQLIIFDLKLNQISEKLLFNHDLFIKVKIFKQYILLIDLNNTLTINEIKNSQLVQKEKIEMQGEVAQDVKIINQNEIFIHQKSGKFYYIKREYTHNDFVMQKMFQPFGKFLTKGSYFLQNKTLSVFWGYNNVFSVYHCNNFKVKPEKVVIHQSEVAECHYFQELECFVSLDFTNTVIVWDPQSYQKKQIISSKKQILYIQIYQKCNKVGFCTNQGIDVYEMSNKKAYTDNLKIISFVYNSYLQKFILLTNKDIRFIDALNGQIDYFKVFSDTKTQDANLIDIAKLNVNSNKQKNEFKFEILYSHNAKNLAIYDIQNFQKIRDLISGMGVVKKDKLDKTDSTEIVIVKYLYFLNVVAVAFKNGNIKLYKFKSKNANMWLRNLLNAHHNQTIICIENFEEIFLSGSNSGQLIIWNLKELKTQSIQFPSEEAILKIQFLNKQNFLVKRTDNKLTHFKYDPESCQYFVVQKIVVQLQHNPMITDFLYFNKILYIADNEGNLHLYKIPFLEKIKILQQQKINFKIREAINFQANTTYIKNPKQITIQSFKEIDLLDEDYLKLDVDQELGIIIARNQNQIKILKDEEIQCFLDIQDMSDQFWKLDFYWLQNELIDLEDAIDILGDLEDKKIMQQDKIEYIENYFKSQYLKIDQNFMKKKIVLNSTYTNLFKVKNKFLQIAQKKKNYKKEQIETENIQKNSKLEELLKKKRKLEQMYEVLDNKNFNILQSFETQKVDNIFEKLKSQTQKAEYRKVINMGEIINENTVPRKISQLQISKSVNKKFSKLAPKVNTISISKLQKSTKNLLKPDNVQQQSKNSQFLCSKKFTTLWTSLSRHSLYKKKDIYETTNEKFLKLFSPQSQKRRYQFNLDKVATNTLLLKNKILNQTQKKLNFIKLKKDQVSQKKLSYIKQTNQIYFLNNRYLIQILQMKIKTEHINFLVWVSYFTIYYYYMKQNWTSYEEFYDSKVVMQMQLIRKTGTLSFALPMIFFAILYYFDFQYFKKYKANDVDWPWQRNKKGYLKELMKHLGLYFFNIFVIAPITTRLYLKVSKMKIDYESFPSLTTMILQFLFLFVMNDFFFYWAHRLLHVPFFYKHIHKWHHEFSVTVAYAVIYAHPLEVIFGNQLTFMIPALALGDKLHLVTYLCFFFYKVVNAHFAHSGFVLPINMGGYYPFQAGPDYHDFHHLKNQGNYGGRIKIWDTIFGTNRYYYEQKEEKKTQQLIK